MKPRTALALIAAAIVLATPVGAAAAGLPKQVTVKIYHATIGPVYQRLADGRIVMVKIDIYYPDTLYYHGPERGLGTVNMTVTTNWTELWNGILTVMVVDPGYKVDNTTFKPVTADNAWADGGAVLGSGSIHIAGEDALHTPVANATIVLHPSLRYFKMAEGVVDAQYFFKARLALFHKTGSKVLGGDILVYTTGKTAPHVRLIINRQPLQEAVETTGGSILGNVAMSAVLASVAVLAVYLGASALIKRARK